MAKQEQKDRDLCSFVAEKVMGWHKERNSMLGPAVWIEVKDGQRFGVLCSRWNPITDDGQAMAVLKYLSSRESWEVNIRSHSRCSTVYLYHAVPCDEPEREKVECVEGTDASLNRAIVLAAAKAFGWEG